MSDLDWFNFFTSCNAILGNGSRVAMHSDNWCSWTTFGRLKEDCFYWQSGLPNQGEFAHQYVKDGGVWGQPFSFSEIAHIIIPAQFYWESFPGKGWECGHKHQAIQLLSDRLTSLKVPHRLTDIILEVKLY